MHAVRNAILGGLSLAIALGASGCDEPPTMCDPCPPVTYRPLTTPYAPLFNLTQTYKLRGQEGADMYATLFDSTLYQFVWNDPATPALEDHYGYTEEMKFRTMFTDPNVASVTLTFLANASDSVGVPSPEPTDPPGARLLTITDISLIIELAGTQYVTNGSCDFTVAQTSTVGGAPQWRIIRWVDHTGPPAAAPNVGASHPVEPSTWGAIKSIYH